MEYFRRNSKFWMFSAMSVNQGKIFITLKKFFENINLRSHLRLSEPKLLIIFGFTTTQTLTSCSTRASPSMSITILGSLSAGSSLVLEDLLDCGLVLESHRLLVTLSSCFQSFEDISSNQFDSIYDKIQIYNILTLSILWKSMNHERPKCETNDYLDMKHDVINDFQHRDCLQFSSDYSCCKSDVVDQRNSYISQCTHWLN